MNASTIERVLRSNPITRRSFIGVYPIDMLPTVNSYPCFGIVNTSESDKSDGHWVLLYMKNNKQAIFFDSYGRSPSNVNNGGLLLKYLNGFNVEFNTHVLQSRFSSVCGHYCIYVAYYLCHNVPLHRISRLFSINVSYDDMLIVDRTCAVYKVCNVLL